MHLPPGTRKGSGKPFWGGSFLVPGKWCPEWLGREVDVDRLPAIIRAMIMHERINFIANEMPFSLEGGSWVLMT